MKILLVGNTYKYGSTGQIAYIYSQELKRRGNECLVAVGKKIYDDEECIELEDKLGRGFHYLMSLITGYEGRFSIRATWKLFKIINEFRPEVVQLFNLHGYYLNIYKLLKFLGKRKIKTVYSMLDEYPYLGHCCYAFECNQFENECRECKLDKSVYIKTLFFRRGHATYKLKKEAYDSIEDITFTGPKWVIERAQKSSLLKEKRLVEVDEFVDADKTYYPRKDDKEFIDKYQECEDKIFILNVSPFSNPRKGGKFFLELAKKLENQRQYIFVHVGYDGSMENLPSNFIPVGYVESQAILAHYFSRADLFVCTSMADTMPNTCLEALACGTPVCGFNITGIPYVADEICGIFVAPGDIEALEKVVLSTAKKSEKMQRYCRKYALSRYSVKKFTNQLMTIYNGDL